jgi:hypothetical protein
VAADASESFWVNTMDDLQRRFTGLDRMDTPDLWPSIEDRARRLAGDPIVERVPRGRLTSVSSTPSFRDRPMLVWLVVVALISALVVGAVSVGAGRLFSVPGLTSSSLGPSAGLPSSVIPSAVAPSAVSPSAVAVGPSASPTADAGACAGRKAVDKTTLTPIAVPDDVSKLVFQGCFVWARIAANNGGIAKIDLGTNRVVDRIVPAELVGDSVTGLDGDILADIGPSIITPDTPLPLIRIDGTTDKVTTVLDLPVNGDFVVLDGQVWNRKYRPGDLWLVPLHGSGPAVKSGTIPPFIGVAFGSVWTRSTDGTAVERWDAPGSAPSATIDVGDDSMCTIADHGIACLSSRGDVVFMSADTNTVAWNVQVPAWTGDAVGLAAMDGSIWVQPAVAQPGRVDAHELIELDATSGAIVRRVPLDVRQPLNLWAGGGSLWIASAEQRLARLDLPPR